MRIANSISPKMTLMVCYVQVANLMQCSEEKNERKKTHSKLETVLYAKDSPLSFSSTGGKKEMVLKKPSPTFEDIRGKW